MDVVPGEAAAKRTVVIASGEAPGPTRVGAPVDLEQHLGVVPAPHLTPPHAPPAAVRARASLVTVRRLVADAVTRETVGRDTPASGGARPRVAQAATRHPCRATAPRPEPTRRVRPGVAVTA